MEPEIETLLRDCLRAFNMTHNTRFTDREGKRSYTYDLAAKIEASLRGKGIDPYKPQVLPDSPSTVTE